MLFLGFAMMLVGGIWAIMGPSLIGLLIAAGGLIIAALDITKTVKKTLDKKKEKDKLKPICSAVCRYDSGLPFETGNCTVTLYTNYVLFDVGGKTASLDLSKITDVSASDGEFRVSYSRDSDTKTVVCAFDASAAGSFTEIAGHIRSNIKYEL